MSPIIVNVEVNEVVVITHRTKIMIFWGQFRTPNLLIYKCACCMHSLKLVSCAIYQCCVECITQHCDALESSKLFIYVT